MIDFETIRQRWATTRWIYAEDWEGEYCASAGVFTAGAAPNGDDDGPWLVDLEEPSEDERDFLKRCAEAPDDVRVLLTQLEHAEAVAEAVAALIQGPGTVAAVRIAGDAYIAWKARSA